MRNRREWMRASLFPFSGAPAKWSSVPSFTSDYIVEELASGNRIRVVESVLDAGFFSNGSYRESGASLSRSETAKAIALLQSKCLRRNLSARSDIWLVPDFQLERIKTRLLGQASEWWPTSVLELHTEAQAISDEEMALKTLHTFGLLDLHHTSPSIYVRLNDDAVQLVSDSKGTISPSGLIYCVDNLGVANEVLTHLVRDGFLEVNTVTGGKTTISISLEGSRLAKQDIPEGFELKSLAKELESHKQHPVPELSRAVHDAELVEILARRWREADSCHRIGAFFAASVLIASMLEGLLLAKIQFEQTRNHEFKKYPEGKTVKAPQDWGLANLLAVCAQEGWIRSDRHRLGHVLKDSRNLVHPANAKVDETEADERSARTYWEILQGVFEDLARHGLS